MKLKNKYTITLLHTIIIAAFFASVIGAIVGAVFLIRWSGINPGWVLLAMAVSCLYGMCSEGVTDEDDWL